MNEKVDEKVIMSEYNDLFQGLGRLEGKVSICLREDARPVIHPPRNVPIALKDRLKTELEKMEEMGVIIKQTEPTEWVNSLVLVVKPNKQLRVCIDPRDLNRAIYRQQFPMNTIEKVATKLNKAKYYTVLDAKSGYRQLELDDTFNTPFGCYRFKRSPFSISAIPEIFQERMLVTKRQFINLLDQLNGRWLFVGDEIV